MGQFTLIVNGDPSGVSAFPVHAQLLVGDLYSLGRLPSRNILVAIS